MGECVDGNLLRLAAPQFDVFLTVDRKLQYQQNLSLFDIAVIVLAARSNTLLDLRPLVPRVLEILANAPRGQATVIELQD